LSKDYSEKTKDPKGRQASTTRVNPSHGEGVKLTKVARGSEAAGSHASTTQRFGEAPARSSERASECG